MNSLRINNRHLSKLRNAKGFTLVELMIGTAVSALVIAGALATYQVSSRTATVQQQLAAVTQNLRGAVYMMEQDIRMTGYDPTSSGNFGVTDIRRYDIPVDLTPLDMTGNLSPILTVGQDINGDGVLGANESNTYLIYDDGNDGINDLGVEPAGTPGARTLIAEGIQAVGFAFAYDIDDDGNLETTGGNINWAVDTDQDNDLDTNLDGNGDGVIAANEAGVALAADAPLDTIRMVRVWLLAQTREQARKCVRFNTPVNYVVGHRTIVDPNDCFRRRTLVRTIEGKNLGL